jgi:hypothetical protein
MSPSQLPLYFDIHIPIPPYSDLPKKEKEKEKRNLHSYACGDNIFYSSLAKHIGLSTSSRFSFPARSSTSVRAKSIAEPGLFFGSI